MELPEIRDCEINATNNYGQTELHVALLGSSVDIIHNLIKQGADVNVQDDERHTPLHYAVDNNNLEAVCMLLCYGADVGAVCKDHMTPFSLAVYRNHTDIAEVLFNYYEDFLETDLHEYSVLQMAAWNKSTLAFDLVNAGIEVNSIPYDRHHPLILSLRYESADLFKLIWSKLDQATSVMEWFLLGFIISATFSANEFVECMYMILSSPIAFDLVDLCEIYYLDRYCGLFSVLLEKCYWYDIELDDRISIILMFLGLGYTVKIDDINVAMFLYGFNEELDIFLYAGGYTVQPFDLGRRHNLIPQPAFIFSVNDVRSDRVIKLFKKQFENMFYYPFELIEIPIRLVFLQNSVVNALRFFSLSFGEKQQLLDHCNLYLDEYDLIAQKLCDVPKVPSLLELSRNQSRVFIQRCYKMNHPYQFHDVVKSLNLPSYLKDIIMFKTPIY